RAPDARERPVDRTDHVGEVDLAGRPAEPVAALGPALAAHEPRVPEVGHDVLEELDRDRLRLRDPLAFDRRIVRSGELPQRTDRVVRLRRDAHARIRPASPAPIRRLRERSVPYRVPPPALMRSSLCQKT